MHLHRKYRIILPVCIGFFLILIGEFFFSSAFKKISVFLLTRTSFHSFHTTKLLLEENKNLKAELVRMRGAFREAQDSLRESEELRKLLAIKHDSSERVMAARVLLKDPSQWRRQMIIDQGRRSGVYEGDLIVDAERNLLGKVLEVADSYSKVLLVNDEEFKIGVVVAGTSALFSGSILKGGKLHYVDYDSEVKVSDEVDLLDTRFSSIRVGQVDFVSRDPATSTVQVFVRPFAPRRFNSYVLVISRARLKPR